jgi:hypothetical protein
VYVAQIVREWAWLANPPALVVCGVDADDH